jgi:hypothetical protein
VPQEFFVPMALLDMLEGGADPFISPTRNGSSKMSSQDRMRYFVREDAVEDSFRRSMDFHQKVADYTLIRMIGR